MNIPFLVYDKLNERNIDIWNNVYASSKGTADDKTVEESLWRRTQDFRNRTVSGWDGPGDKRRKVVYYFHEYDLLHTPIGRPYIGLVKTYVYICLTLPKNEADDYKKIINESIEIGSWKISKRHNEFKVTYKRGDLLLDVVFFQKVENNPFEYDFFSDNYVSLEIKLYSNNISVDDSLLKKPWGVLRSGLRRKLDRGNPKYFDNPRDILDFFPAQVELGCGPSYEAGVPPLHELHYLYSINEPLSKKFIITADEDNFLPGLISHPDLKYNEMTGIFVKILDAPLTDFYFALKKLFKYNYFVGPVITNNFDGLHLRLGLEELFVRKYEESVIVPKVNFHPQAKSLLVVGSHADRRFVQESARRKGLKVIYIDPEGWWLEDKFYSYPLESPQDEDIIFKQGATQFFIKLASEIFKQ